MADRGLAPGFPALLRVDDRPDGGIVHLLGQRPRQLVRPRGPQDVRRRRLRASAREGDAVLAHPHRSKPQELDHALSFL